METTANNQNFTPENGGKRRTYRKTKVNQLIFVEYEKPKDNGHKYTVVDSYKNLIGRVYEKYDEPSGKMEYIVCDYENNLLFRADNMERVKEEFFARKEFLLEQAYQRRLEKIKAMREQRLQQEKAQTKSVIRDPKPQPNQEKQQEKSPDQKNPMSATEREKTYPAWKREQELKDLRETKLQDKSQELGR